MCQIVSTFPPLIGGIQRATASLSGALLAHGVDVIVMTRRYPGAPARDRVAGVSVFRLGLPLASRLGALVFAVHAIGLLMTRFKDYRVLHVQNIDAPMLVGLIGRVLLRRRLVATIHAELQLAGKERTLLGRLRLRAMKRYVGVFIALGSKIQTRLFRLGIARERVRVIPNGIDTNEFRPPAAEDKRRAREALGVSEECFVALFAGRLVQLKRVDLLLQAWTRAVSGNAVLIIVGEGPEGPSLKQMAQSMNAANVRFEGATSRMQVYFWAADVFVLPSDSEGLSVALLEAMAVGLPVVTTSVGGHVALVNHGENGYLVPVGKVRPLAECLARLAESPAVRDRIGSVARSLILREYSLAAVARRHLDLYRAAASLDGGSHPMIERSSSDQTYATSRTSVGRS